MDKMIRNHLIGEAAKLLVDFVVLKATSPSREPEREPKGYVVRLGRAMPIYDDDD